MKPRHVGLSDQVGSVPDVLLSLVALSEFQNPRMPRVRPLPSRAQVQRAVLHDRRDRTGILLREYSETKAIIRGIR